MVRSSNAISILVAGAVVLAACGGGDGDTDVAGGSVTLDTAATDVGDVLVDGDGMTLYMFDEDGEGESACVDDCAATWPPVTGQAEVAGEVDEGLVGTTTRPDGSSQVTYGGFPLYLYAADAEPGDVNGQGVGEVWWAVGPDGSRITGEPAAEGTGSY